MNKLFITVFLLGSILHVCKTAKLNNVDSTCPPDAVLMEPTEVPEEGFPFCSEYRDTSCCNSEHTLAIKETVDQLMDSKCSTCYQLVSEWKCAECHPTAASFYEAGGNCEQCTSLLLCEDYCYAIFDNCKDIPFATNQGANHVFYLNEPTRVTREEWCEDKIADEGTCYRGTIPKEVDNACKCPDHRCHFKSKTSQDPSNRSEL